MKKITQKNYGTVVYYMNYTFEFFLLKGSPKSWTKKTKEVHYHFLVKEPTGTNTLLVYLVCLVLDSQDFSGVRKGALLVSLKHVSYTSNRSQ